MSVLFYSFVSLYDSFPLLIIAIISIRAIDCSESPFYSFPILYVFLRIKIYVVLRIDMQIFLLYWIHKGTGSGIEDSSRSGIKVRIKQGNGQIDDKIYDEIDDKVILFIEG